MRIRKTSRVAGAVVLLVAAFMVVTPDARASVRKGTTDTWVAGAWQATPSLFLTGGGDIPNCRDVTYTALATLMGSFSGVWKEKSMTATCDATQLPKHFRYHTSGEGTMTGVHFGDQSHGTLTWTGHWDGDMISGESTGVFDITGGGGDATFKCSSGRLTFAGYTGAITSFGGYSGSWVHGCAK
jgi:hypothetical protein